MLTVRIGRLTAEGLAPLDSGPYRALPPRVPAWGPRFAGPRSRTGELRARAALDNQISLKSALGFLFRAVKNFALNSASVTGGDQLLSGFKVVVSE